MIAQDVHYQFLADKGRCLRFLLIGCMLFISRSLGVAQQSPLPDAPQPQTQSPQPNPAQQGSKGEYGKHHILWIIPNYRSDESTMEFKPVTAR